MPGTLVWVLVWEDPTCLRATGPVNHNYWSLRTVRNGSNSSSKQMGKVNITERLRSGQITYCQTGQKRNRKLHTRRQPRWTRWPWQSRKWHTFAVLNMSKGDRRGPSLSHIPAEHQFLCKHRGETQGPDEEQNPGKICKWSKFSVCSPTSIQIY